MLWIQHSNLFSTVFQIVVFLQKNRMILFSTCNFISQKKRLHLSSMESCAYFSSTVMCKMSVQSLNKMYVEKMHPGGNFGWNFGYVCFSIWPKKSANLWRKMFVLRGSRHNRLLFQRWTGRYVHCFKRYKQFPEPPSPKAL